MTEVLKDGYAGLLHASEVLLRDLDAPLLVRGEGVSHGRPRGSFCHWVD